jgi:hypothetical protein
MNNTSLRINKVNILRFSGTILILALFTVLGEINFEIGAYTLSFNLVLPSVVAISLFGREQAGVIYAIAAGIFTECSIGGAFAFYPLYYVLCAAFFACISKSPRGRRFLVFILYCLLAGVILAAITTAISVFHGAGFVYTVTRYTLPQLVGMIAGAVIPYFVFGRVL